VGDRSWCNPHGGSRKSRGWVAHDGLGVGKALGLAARTPEPSGGRADVTSHRPLPDGSHGAAKFNRLLGSAALPLASLHRVQPPLAGHAL